MAGDSLCAAQAQHGSAPDIAGEGVANATSLYLSAEACCLTGSATITTSLGACLEHSETRTRDLQGLLLTDQFAD